MKKNRLFALLLAAIMLLSLLAGCTGNPGGSDPTKDPGPGTKATPKPAAPVELNVVTSYGGDDGNRKSYENAVKGYEDATGNRVQDASGTSNEEWKAKVLTDFETGTEPDVLFFFTSADAEPIIQAGKVVDVATIRAEYPDYASNMRDSMLAVASDGKNYAIPSSGFWENMFVNTKVLSDCGVAVPGPDYTWDQFLADCQTIKDKGYTPIACSLFEVPHYWFEFCVMNNGTLADAETVQLFGDGEAAFLIDGSWKVNYFVDNHGETLEDYVISYVPAKGERKASEAIGGISMGYFITKKAWDDPAKREAAVQFVKHMTGDMTAEEAVAAAIALN